MTKGERDQLTQLIRKREKVMKTQARERSAALLAEFDASMAKIYNWDEDAIWAQVHAEAQSAVASAQEAVEKRCDELGIPREFAPSLNFHWHGRGHNAFADRRSELRRAARSRIEARETEALSKIERMSLEAQTAIIANGIESQAAKDFLGSLTPLDALMPPIEVGEIQALVETRVAERKKNYLLN